MGRKCYESIGRPLPKRLNIIITRNLSYEAAGCTIVHSIEKAIEVAKATNPTEIFIIGGGEIYKETLPWCQKLYLTEVATTISDATVFFPVVASQDWVLQKEEVHRADEKNEYDYTFKVLVRKTVL
jgi:dihydrofolate reductase